MSAAGLSLQASTHRIKASRTSAAGISLQASATSLSRLIRRIKAATGSGSHLSALGQASWIVILLRGYQVTCVSFVLSPRLGPSSLAIMDIPRAHNVRIVFIAADIKSGDLVLMDKVQWPLAVALDTVPCVHGPVTEISPRTSSDQSLTRKAVLLEGDGDVLGRGGDC